MPELRWLGKDKVINHHNDIPFRILEPQYTFGEEGTENRIIHGDNLEALKALLPYYEGRIKCIYIDPPYNTGNENWVYNDNVNDPKIRRWLGKVVGKESEDLTRHDKWLCMMYPRLVLLHRLLADDGAIFVSIDDNEQASLKLMMDEIWGKRAYTSSYVWRRRTSSQMAQNNISVDHEYVICYSKDSTFKALGRVKDYANYANPDNDPNGLWTLGDLTVGMTKDQRPNQFYDLIDPKTGISYPANPKRVWTYIPESMNAKMEAGRIKFPANDKGRPMLKRYLKDLKSDINPISTLLIGDQIKVGLNTEGTKILQDIFNSKVFDYPKPISLLTEVLSQFTSNNDIILDSFAGSGTTAHAVLNLNKQDGGNRRFILVEMEDYAETITAERVRRVINGYGGKEGTGGGFTYYELGPPLFTDDELLNESLPLARIREYVWYSETKTALPTPDTGAESPHFLGKYDETAYYFYYESNELTTLDYDFLSTVQTPAEQYVIYADNCLIAREWLQQRHISFKKIPRDINRF
jgi:adenine-specific DNA-methyltransferase